MADTSFGILIFVVLFTGCLAIWPFTNSEKPPEKLESNGCAKDCFYWEANATLSCSNSSCTAIPETKPGTKVMILEVNHITEIRALQLESLEILDLSVNKIDYIQPGAFANCKNLKHIDLSLNEMKTLTNRTFEILAMPSDEVALQNLDLSYNKIEVLDIGVFRAHLQKSLEILDLSNNIIRDIHLETFKDLHRLKRLILSSNEISTIKPNHLKGLYSLTELDLNDNHLTTIYDFSFSDLDHLVTLDLKFNDLYAVETDAFRGLDNLEELILSHNHITTLDPELFAPLVSLTDLHLDFNPVMTIYPESFPSGLVYLTMVGMSNLEQIPPMAFANCRVLDTVHLGQNPNLKIIASDAFRGNDSSIKQLDIRNNQLSEIGEHMLNWERLTNLDMRGNIWNCDCQMSWILKKRIPQRNLDEMRCTSPESLANHTVGRLTSREFSCTEKKLSHRQIFRMGMLGVTTFAFFFLLFSFLYKCRHRVMPCWFGKQPGKYFALYNAKDEEEGMTSANGYASQGIIKHRNGTPAPVHV